MIEVCVDVEVVGVVVEEEFVVCCDPHLPPLPPCRPLPWAKELEGLHNARHNTAANVKTNRMDLLRTGNEKDMCPFINALPVPKRVWVESSLQLFQP